MQKKNIIIVLLLIIIIILCYVVFLKPKDVNDIQPIQNQDGKSVVDELNTKSIIGQQNVKSFRVQFPAKDSILKRGTSYNIEWTGKANCYVVGFFFDDPNGETPYNIITKEACRNSSGLFSLNWTIPADIKTGMYKIQFSAITSQPLNEGMTNSDTFIID